MQRVGTPREFDSCLSLLPETLRDRVIKLRRRALADTGQCDPCKQAQQSIWLSFDAAFLGDHAAAQQLVEQAETEAVSDRHLSSCARHLSATAPSQAQPRQVPGFTGLGPLVAATDAAYKQRRGGFGYLVTDGRWGMRTWSAPRDQVSAVLEPTGASKVLVSELRAVALLLDRLGPNGGQLTRLLMDSTTAIGYLRSWQDGDVERMPKGYSLRPRIQADEPTLVRLARRVAELPQLRVEHVSSHSGHPLNEAADALAELAMRKPPDRVARAEGLVEAFLQVWHTQEKAGKR